MTLYDENGKPAISIWCEGMCILAYDGNVRKKIYRYKDEFWFSVWVSLDTNRKTYDVCIDGEKCLSGAVFMNPVSEIALYETGTRMGSFMEKQIFVYRNPVQSIEEAAGKRKIYNVAHFGAVADGVNGVIIQGGGTIDGSGNFPGDYGSESRRPSAILLVGCNHSKIQNIAVNNAGMWTIPLMECDSILYERCQYFFLLVSKQRWNRLM